ncbi:uncharacterized protein LOC110978178 [Acanthaster planci]|uniref:Uncharacterized protein LOC110978178 n=1 Tax=Acanthaster planci TaxID=133434 RepID=A0A8B7Y7W5_ACAPL|nr:uncharacterized protein LOC110978178 [Acanthaster planci]
MGQGFPIPDLTAETVTQTLVEQVITHFGTPLEIHTDQGREFEAGFFQGVRQLLGIQKTRTMPFHPQSDGMVECFNRTVKTILSMFVDENQKNWDKHLPYVTMAYRSSQHDSTLNMLMLGREVGLPLDVVVGSPEGQPEALEVHEYVDGLRMRIERSHEFARRHLQRIQRYQKWQYDRRAQGAGFEPEQAAWLYNPAKKVGRAPKLQRYWKGPFAVLDCIDVTYMIQKSTRAKPPIVHYWLKTYLGVVDLGWWRRASAWYPAIEENGELRPTGPTPCSTSQSTEPTPKASKKVGKPWPLGSAPGLPHSWRRRHQKHLGRSGSRGPLVLVPLAD